MPNPIRCSISAARCARRSSAGSLSEATQRHRPPTMHFDFAQPLFLLLLPLALLPLLRRRADTLAYPSVAWLPRDRAGRLLGLLWRALAVSAMASTIVGLAGPGQPGAEVVRSGRGAELLILMDRSSSMDNVAFLNGVNT